MNKITLKGKIQDIQYSHTIGTVQYDKANLIVQNDLGNQSIIQVKFKKYSNKYKQGDIISLVGNLRSYSKQINKDKNKVNIYVFTYMDLPENPLDGIQITNKVELDGRICKMADIHQFYNGKNIQFILANNIDLGQNKKLNSYIPCIAYNQLAQKISKFEISDQVKLVGQFRSRQYKKKLENDQLQIRIAHQVVITDIQKVK